MNQCKFCGAPAKRTFCSASCAGKWATTTPEGKAKFYTKERGQKITASKKQWHLDNPEKSKAIVEKMLDLTPEEKAAKEKRQSETMKRLGYGPKFRGGNGTGPTQPEIRLLKMVPRAVWNYGIKTGKWNGSGFPPVYKVDLAIPEIKLAIEADGGSHNLHVRKAQDKKKDDFLRGLGWTVLRFENWQIMDFRTQVEVLADIEYTISKLEATQATASTV